MEDRRWIRQNLLTFRWCLVSSVGVGAFEVARLAHHAILDLIPPAIVFFVRMAGTREERGIWVFGEAFCIGQFLIGNLSAHGPHFRVGANQKTCIHSALSRTNIDPNVCNQ